MKDPKIPTGKNKMASNTLEVMKNIIENFVLPLLYKSI